MDFAHIVSGLLDFAHILSGLLVGVLVGLTGVGGGSLMTPIMVLLLGVAPSTAVGTDLWFAAITKSVGGMSHHKSNNVDWVVFKRLAWGSIPATIATLLLMQFGGFGQIKSETLTRMIGIALIVSAAAYVAKKSLHKIGTQLRISVPQEFKRAQPALTVLSGAVIGVLVTLTSVGAGSLCAVMLLYLYPFRMTPQKLVGTDVVHAVPLVVVAGLGHLWLGNVNFVLLGSLLIGSIPGVLMGAKFAERANTTLLRVLISMALVAVGVKMLA